MTKPDKVNLHIRCITIGLLNKEDGKSELEGRGYDMQQLRTKRK